VTATDRNGNSAEGELHSYSVRAAGPREEDGQAQGKDLLAMLQENLLLIVGAAVALIIVAVMLSKRKK